MIALYVGEIDVNKIYEITYPFYRSLVAEIGIMLNYEARSHLLGNGNISPSDASEAIEDSNPFNYREKRIKRLTMDNIINTPLGKGR